MSAVYWFSPSARYFHVMDCVGSFGRAGAGSEAGVGPGRLVTVSCGAAAAVAFAGAAGDATLALLLDAKCGAGAWGPRGVNLLFMVTFLAPPPGLLLLAAAALIL